MAREGSKKEEDKRINVPLKKIVCSPEFGSSSDEATGDSSMIDIIMLTHLVSLAGDVALQQLVHLELSVSNELRRRRVLGEERDAKEKAASTVKVQNSKVRAGILLVYMSTCLQLFQWLAIRSCYSSDY